MGFVSENHEKEYTARELAKILNVTQQTIINRCKSGQLKGAEKRPSPWGEMWFIPESALDFAQEVVDVVKVEKAIELKDFENSFKAVLAPLYAQNQEIFAQSQELVEQNKKLAEEVAALHRKIENLESHDHEIVTQIRVLSEMKNKGFWARLLGR